MLTQNANTTLDKAALLIDSSKAELEELTGQSQELIKSLNTLSINLNELISDETLKNDVVGSIKSVGKMSFSGCVSLSSVSIPESVNSIESYAFEDCTALTTVNIPSATNIGGLAFGGCVSLKSINAPNVTTIGIRAFAASGIEVVNFSKVTSIAKSPFDSCGEVTIYAPLNSYAHQYAKENGIKFVELLR